MMKYKPWGTISIGDPVRLTSGGRVRRIKGNAIKHDSEKPRMHLVPPRALLAIAQVFTFGAKKYADYNYRNGSGLNWTRVSDAAQRHLQAWLAGEDNDSETNISHLAHLGCCVLMLMDLQERGKGKDDRPKY